jgi:hypothetical protein
MEQFITVLENGLIEAADVETALNEMLAHFGVQGLPSLEGSEALVLEVSSSELRLQRFVARTRSGRRVAFQNVILPLPEVPTGESLDVRVGFVWGPLPTRDGSSLLYGRCRLVLLEPGAGGADGELTLGRLTRAGFTSLAIRSSRLDSARANLSWWKAAQDCLHDLDGDLLLMARHLDRESGPKLGWVHTLADVQFGLARARSIQEDHSTDEARAALEGLVRAFATLPERAAAYGDPHLGEFWATLSVPRPLTGADLEELLEALRTLRTSLATALSELGIAIVELPLRLYRDGHLYRRTTLAPMEPESSTGGESIFRVHPAPPRSKASLAILWRSTRPTALGEVRTFHKGGSRPSQDERYHEGIAGTGFHWVERPDPVSLRIRASADLRLLQAAFYEPLEDRCGPQAAHVRGLPARGMELR